MQEIETIKEQIRDLDERLRKIEDLTNQPSLPKNFEKQMSLREFVLSKKPSGNPQIGLCVLYYLEYYENKESFNVADLEAGFRRAKEKVPSNVSDVLQKIAKKGFIDQTKSSAKGKNEWTLTNSGVKEVEDGFKGGSK
jgi:hypothetical protein